MKFSKLSFKKAAKVNTLAALKGRRDAALTVFHKAVDDLSNIEDDINDEVALMEDKVAALNLAVAAAKVEADVLKKEGADVNAQIAKINSVLL